MAVTKITGDPTLDLVIGKINKEYSKPLLATRPGIKQMAALPTGSLGLDCAVGIGGLPQGRVIEINGLEATGKTSWSLYWAKQAQQLDTERFVFINDAEHTMTENQITGYGLDMDRVIYSRPDNISECLDPMMALVKSGRICYAVLDSVDALQTEAMLNKGITEADVGGISKIMARFLREYSKVADRTNCTSVFINQTKYNPSPFAANGGKTTPGGTALRFYASLRMECTSAKPSKKTKNAFTSSIKILKNRAAAPVDRKIEVDFVYARGPDPVMDHLNTAKDLGVLAFGGQALYLLEPDGTKKSLCSGGAEGFAELCVAKPETLDMIRERCMQERLKLPTVVANEEDESAVKAEIEELLGVGEAA